LILVKIEMPFIDAKNTIGNKNNISLKKMGENKTK
jgi:hypothetical protein